MARIRAVLFDLDGTLVQTRESSWVLFERVNREFDLGIDGREGYFDLFRENVFEALPRVCGDPVKAEAALERFLELMREEYAPPLVPGMKDVVRDLSKDHVLGIVSSNALSAIRRIAETHGIANCIAHIFGGDVVPDKRVAIRRILGEPSYAALRPCSDAYEEKTPKGLQPQEVVLVTDTVGDTRHALECGVRVIGVPWGLHSPEELKAAGADFVAQWPMEVLSWVRHPFAAAPEAKPEAKTKKSAKSPKSGANSSARPRKSRAKPEEEPQSTAS